MAIAIETLSEARDAFEELVEERTVFAFDRAITFEEYLDIDIGREIELVGGVLVERMSAQLDHERLLRWLTWLVHGYVDDKELGIVLGSRSVVQIGPYDGRMPDLLFVRNDRMDIVGQRAIYGAPDLAVEVRSPNDRLSDLAALESDYAAIGVPEIWFTDPKRKVVRVLRKSGETYQARDLTSGTLGTDAIDGFSIQVEWLFAEPRPAALGVLQDLLAPVPD